MFEYSIDINCNNETEWYCGYVEIPKNSWLFGVSYDTITQILKDNKFWLEFPLSYEAKDDFNEIWIIGFDTRDSNEKSEEKVEIFAKNLSEALFELQLIYTTDSIN